MADSEQSSAVDDSVPAPAPPPPRRFLSADRGDGSDGTAVGHLLFNAAALFILTVALIGIMFTFTDQLGDRLLVTGYVRTTDSSEYVPLPFIRNDLERLQSTPGMLRAATPSAAPLANLETEADFERLFAEILPAVTQDTLILAIRCHSVTTDAGTFLQPVDADPLRPESGVALRRLLDTVAGCRAASKLVLLDIVPQKTDLDLGVPCQLAADQVRSDFKAISTSGVSAGNFWILMANDSGQSSGTSFACRHSAFSLFVAYCLGGGRAADEAGRDDGVLTAAELASFVEKSVADWSIRFRGTLQRPFCLKSGDDFPVAGIRDLMTLDAWLDEETAEQDESEEPAPETADTDETQPADDAEVPGGPAAGSTRMTAEQLLAEIHQLWQARRELRDGPAPTRRPRHWMLLARYLQRAERQLLAGNLDGARQVLTVDVAALQQDVATPLVETIRFPWTAAFDDLEVDADTERAREDLQTALIEPSARHLNLIADSPFVEATLARRLAPTLATSEDSWSEPQLVAAAVEVRQLAERTARLTAAEENSETTLLSRPWLLPFVRSDIEAADSARISAEQALPVQRLSVAATQFRRASRMYDDAESRARRLARQLHEIHLAALDAVDILRWLEADVPGPEYTKRTELLTAMIDGTVELCRAPHEELLAPLLMLVHELRRTIANDVKDSLLQSTTEHKLALLHLSFLEPADRSQLLLRLLEANDRPVLHDSLADFNQQMIPRQQMCPETLAALFAAMGVETDTTELETDSPKSRETHQRLASSLQHVLNELKADPLALPELTASGAWEQYLNHLYRASFQAELLSETRFQPVLSNMLLNRMSSEHLMWQLERLRRSELASGGNDSRPRKQIASSLKQLDPGYQETDSVTGPAFTARNLGSQTADDGSHTDIRFSVSANTDIQRTDRVHLVLDWYAQRNQLQVLSATDLSTGQKAMAAFPDSDAVPTDLGTPAGSAAEQIDQWRLRLPVAELAEGDVKIEVRLATGSAAETAAATAPDSLTAWLELADDSTWALPLSLRRQTDDRPAFELQLVGPHSEAVGRRIEVFANESFPMTLQVVSRQQEPREVELEIRSGSSSASWPATITPGPQPLTLQPTTDGQLQIEDGRLEIRIIDSGDIISHVFYEVRVQNPAVSFVPSLNFDVSSRKVSATIKRLTASAARIPVNTAMEVVQVELAEGKLESLIEAGESDTTMDATIVDDADLTVFSVELSVAGVPRMFMFDVDAVTGRVQQRNSSRIRIVSPEEGDVCSLAGTEPTLDVAVQVDSPRDCEVHVGIDRNANDYLESAERMRGGRFWRGRIVHTQLVLSPETGELTLSSSVSDLSFPINTAGVAGRQRILAQLLAGDQTITAGSTVYFVDHVPALEFQSPGPAARVAFAAPLTVAVSSDPVLFPVIEGVEIGVDRNANGLWEEEETLAPLEPMGERTLTFDGRNTAAAVFDGNQLLQEQESADPPVAAAEAAESAAMVTLMARAIRRNSVGEPETEPSERTGKVIRRRVQLIDPSELPAETGSVVGLVTTADGLGQRNVAVFLGETATQTDDAGQFHFTEVPAGVHTIVADTPRREGSAVIEVEAGETARAEIQLRLR